MNNMYAKWGLIFLINLFGLHSGLLIASEIDGAVNNSCNNSQRKEFDLEWNENVFDEQAELVWIMNNSSDQIINLMGRENNQDSEKINSSINSEMQNLTENKRAIDLQDDTRRDSVVRQNACKRKKSE